MNYRERIEHIMKKLEPVYETSRELRQVAWWMMEAITGMSRATLLAHQPSLTQEQESLLNDWIEQQRIYHKPLQYLIGYVPFLDLSIKVEPPVAIPRPETEFWVSSLIEEFSVVKNQKLHILDLCTGSGCIALALAHGLPESQVIGVDIHEKALEIARQNKKDNSIENAEFIYSDLFTNLYEIKFDLIVGNPPYISSEEWESLDPRVTKWEDEAALRANENGLEIIRCIIDQATQFFKLPSVLQDHQLPQLILEIGSTQGPRALDLIRERGYTNSSVAQDQYGNDRIVRASYHEKKP